MALLPAIGENYCSGRFSAFVCSMDKKYSFRCNHLSFLSAFFILNFMVFYHAFIGCLIRLFSVTSSLWVCLANTFINNFVIVCYFYFMPSSGNSSAIDQIGTTADIYLLISIITDHYW